MVPAMLRIYTGEFSDSRISFKNEALVRELLTRLYAGVTTESIKVIFLDLNMRYIACESLCDSSNAYSVGIDPKKIVQRAEMHNCTNIVLTHNHPEDTCTPSSQDIRATLKMKEVFEGLNIVLVDHIIFSNLDNKIYSMRDKGHLRDRNRM
jgi:DNA repair protein RadC